MEGIHFLDLFQGIATLVASEPKIMFGRIFLMLLGFLLIYLGSKNILEPLLMIPMGLGMSAVNAGVMFLDGQRMGTLFVDPLMSDPVELINIMQIDWLQPIYTLTFSNGLIACLVFMGIGVLLDVGYVMARPFQSMFIALFAELGTIAVFPIAVWLGLNPGQAAAVATIGGADGPMVLFTSLVLAKDLFVPITVDPHEPENHWYVAPAIFAVIVPPLTVIEVSSVVTVITVVTILSQPSIVVRFCTTVPTCAGLHVVAFTVMDIELPILKMVALSFAIQAPASVTVTLYVPADNPLISSVVAPLLHK